MTTSSRSRPRTLLYLAETDAAARDGAAALEGVPSGTDWAVQPLATDSLEQLASWAPDADCIVFAETPTTAAGATLLEAIDVCGSTPLVLFTDASYAPTAARGTDGVDGYVRRDTDDAVAHLADEIAWVCGGDGEPDPRPGSGAAAASDDGDASARQASDRLLESVPDIAACDDRSRLFEGLVETATDAFGFAACWLSTVHFGEFTPRAAAGAITLEDLESTPREGTRDEALRTGEPVRIEATDDRANGPLEGNEPVYCVPVGDAGLLQAAPGASTAFDDRGRDALAAWCRLGAAVLERLETESNLRSDRDRLRRERNSMQSRRDRLVAKRDELAAERDRTRALLEAVPDPALWYGIDDDGRPIVRRITDAFVDVFGTDPERLVDTPLDGTTVPPGLEGRREPLLETLRGDERRRLARRSDTVDGVREFRITLVPPGAVWDDGGADHGPAGLIVYRDVTESNRRERTLARAEQRLEVLAEVLEDDVRPAMNLARGYLELVEETGDEEHFAEIEGAQDQVHDRLEELIAIARRETDLLETEPVALHDVARRAWADLETGDARLTVGDDLVFAADETQLRELFEHLFRRAVGREDGESAGDDRVVTVGATDDGFHVTGHDADGTGFGLEPVERIADVHGWSVAVADDETGRVVIRGVDPADVDGH